VETAALEFIHLFPHVKKLCHFELLICNHLVSVMKRDRHTLFFFCWCYINYFLSFLFSGCINYLYGLSTSIV